MFRIPNGTESQCRVLFYTSRRLSKSREPNFASATFQAIAIGTTVKNVISCQMQPIGGKTMSHRDDFIKKRNFYRFKCIPRYVVRVSGN